MNKVKGFFSLLVCAVIFGLFGVFVRILNQDLQSYQQVGFRNVIALVVSIVAVTLAKQSFSSVKKVPPTFLILYMIMFPLSVVLYTLAAIQTKIVTTVFGLYLGSLVTSLVIGVLAFKEKITLLKAMSLVLVGLGLFTYAYPFGSSALSVGFLLSILSGFFDASANSFRKYLAGRVDRFVLVVLQMCGGLAVSIPLMFLFNQMSVPSISPTTWAVGLIFGCLLVAISYFTLIGFQNFDLNLGTIILSSEIFFASLFAFLFFHEQSTFNELLGGVLIILATVLANLSIEKDSYLDRLQVAVSKAFNIIK